MAGDVRRWRVHRLSGSAAALHGRPWPDTPMPSAWILQVDRPALVLGSTQADEVVSGDVDVVRRRTGGGAVLLRPGSVVWVDVLVPAGDRLWQADVGRAFWWLGETWVEALAALGVAGPRWHDGALIRSPLGDRVCFAGLGPGEVTVGDRKAVGMSQRRTRQGALFQCAALLAWEPDTLAALLGLDAVDLDELRRSAAPLPVTAEALEEAFLDALRRR